MDLWFSREEQRAASFFSGLYFIEFTQPAPTAEGEMTTNHTMKTLLAISSAVLGAVAFMPFSLGAAPTAKPTAEVTIAQAIGVQRDLTTFSAYLQSSGLADVLDGTGAFTLFAPSDAAFAHLPKSVVESIAEGSAEGRARLQDLLRFHVVAGAVGAPAVRKLTSVAALNGQRASIGVSGKSTTVAGAKITATETRCANGVIHFLDAVMVPEIRDLAATLADTGNHGVFLRAVKAAGLDDVLSGSRPMTFLAPTDEAFAALPEGVLEELLQPENKARLARILKHHVIPGRVFMDQLGKVSMAPTLGGQELLVRVAGEAFSLGVPGSEAKLVGGDVQAANGVIHVVDAVIQP